MLEHYTNTRSATTAPDPTSRATGAKGRSLIWEIASSLIFGLINNHPFHDANKRTAFLSSVFFMQENDYTPRVDIDDIENFTVEIAEYHHTHGVHITNDDLSPQFKKMFRKIDSRIAYTVTYRELEGILKNHGCSLRNPHGNYIDVFAGDTKVAQIGFPGWGSEVRRNAIGTVRKNTGLIPENGVDAQVFFKEADPLNVLIGQYEKPLRRLANR